MPPNSRLLAKIWLYIAIASLAIAGLYSLPPVILRGSYFESFFEDIQAVFDVALTIHVDLSVLVWLLSMAGVAWSLSIFPSFKERFVMVMMASLSCIGILLMLISSFMENPNPLKSDYIPILDHSYFIQGLLCFMIGILGTACITLFHLLAQKLSSSSSVAKIDDLQAVMKVGSASLALIIIISMVCFILSYWQLPVLAYTENRLLYFQLLFWGGGHLLQFAFTQLVMIAWFYGCIKLTQPPHHKIVKWAIGLLILNGVLAIAAIAIYTIYPVDSPEFYHLFTQHMRYVGGIAPSFAAIVTLILLFRRPSNNSRPAWHQPIRYSLYMSVFLFLYGGLLALNISGHNVVIPAHYHGSIVGTSIGLIAFCFGVMHALKIGIVQGKLAKLQPLLFGGGQFLHITGLAWMGGYGALRKEAASTASIDTMAGKICFFTGGALAIIGGLLFIVVTIRAMLHYKKYKSLDLRATND